MDFSPWDLCDSFRLHEAACLMAGVSPISKRVPSREELPPHAIPYYVKLAKAYFLGAYVFDRPEDKRFQRETLLIGNSTDGTDKPDLPGSIEKLTGELVSRAELQRWIEVVGIKSVYLFAPVVAQPQADAIAVPLPLTTTAIAHCFCGIKWKEQAWKKALGFPPKWLLQSMVTRGQQGKHQASWNPLHVGAALVGMGIPTNRVRARFQTKAELRPWREAWKDYEAEHLTAE